MNENKKIWFPCNEQQLHWVDKFKEILILQKRENIGYIFDLDNFGIHNSFTVEQYCDYEFEEFALKCEKFDLTLDALITCYALKDNYFYFSLGKKNDKAVFEAIFKWCPIKNLALGNGYNFKIEPKTQFIMHNNGEESIHRRVNITPREDIYINAIIQKEIGEDFVFNKVELPAHLGGRFYNLQYTRTNDKKESFWDVLKIATNQGIKSHSVLMRGIDHPLFISDLYPEVNNHNSTIIIKNDIYPVVLYVLLEDGEELFYKYPLEKSWTFSKKIKTVCLTDTLSFDWIIEL